MIKHHGLTPALLLSAMRVGRKRVMLTASTALSSAFLLASTAYGQDNSMSQLLPDKALGNNSIMMVILVGAFSFAMWSATWLIKERRSLEENNRSLELEHADLRARHERAQALLDVPDQRVVIWETLDGSPICRGTLPPQSGAPSDPSEFVGFGTWMTPAAAQSFENAVHRLRKKAESFDLTVESRNGSSIEVQGRASGSHAFVRFLSLSGDRAALAALEGEHTRLQQTSDMMQNLLEAIPFPVWLRDRQDSLTWANAAYVNAVEGASLDSVARHNARLLDQGARESMSSALAEERVRQERALAHAEEDETPSNMRKKSKVAMAHIRQRLPVTIIGDRRVVDVSEVHHADGSAGLAVDMSEVETVRSKLRRTLESHAQTMNQLATAVAIFDQKRHLTFYNDAFQALWKLDDRFLEEEPDNGRLFDALRENGKLAEQPDWSKWRNGLMSVYEDTEPQHHFWQLPDNRMLRVVANPHKQGGATWVFENVTEQLQLENRFNELTRVQGETLDHLGEAIAVFAANGRLSLSNPSFQTLWKLDKEQVAAETPLAAIVDLCRPAMADPAVWDTLITGITGVSDARKTQDGRLELLDGKTLDYALVPLPNGQTLLSFADVTANVNFEHTLKERNEALVAAEKLKNAFIEHVSYEFRAPLTSIKGFAEVLEQQAFGPLNPKQQEYIGHISASSMVLHSLVDNILDLAQVDAGIIELDLETLPLSDVLQAAGSSVKKQLKDKGIRLDIRRADNASETSSSFVADVNRVQQVLYNLLTNAIAFSPKGGTIELGGTSDADSVILTVSDNGPGIPPEQRSSIFERFASKARAGGRRGAGLGLSIARSMVELHGGTIELDPTISNGTRFVCRFPKKPMCETVQISDAAQ